MSLDPRTETVKFHVPATISADATDIPFWWNSSGHDWYLDGDNPPSLVMVQSYTGSGSTSDGTKFLRTKLLRVSAAAVETGLCEHVLTTNNNLTAQVGDDFDKMTGSS